MQGRYSDENADLLLNVQSFGSMLKDWEFGNWDRLMQLHESLSVVCSVHSIRETKNSDNNDEFDDSAVSPPDGDAHVVGNSMVIQEIKTTGIQWEINVSIILDLMHGILSFPLDIFKGGHFSYISWLKPGDLQNSIAKILHVITWFCFFVPD